MIYYMLTGVTTSILGFILGYRVMKRQKNKAVKKAYMRLCLKCGKFIHVESTMRFGYSLIEKATQKRVGGMHIYICNTCYDEVRNEWNQYLEAEDDDEYYEMDF